MGYRVQGVGVCLEGLRRRVSGPRAVGCVLSNDRRLRGSLALRLSGLCLGSPGKLLFGGRDPGFLWLRWPVRTCQDCTDPNRNKISTIKPNQKTSKQSLLNLKLPLKPQSKAHSKKAKSEANRPVLDDVSVLARLSSGFAEQRSCGT